MQRPAGFGTAPHGDHSAQGGSSPEASCQRADHLTCSLIFLLGVSRGGTDVTGPLSTCCFELSVTMASLKVGGASGPVESRMGTGQGTGQDGGQGVPGTFDTGPAQTTGGLACSGLMCGQPEITCVLKKRKKAKPLHHPVAPPPQLWLDCVRCPFPILSKEPSFQHGALPSPRCLCPPAPLRCSL